MSNSEPATGHGLLVFDEWLAHEFDRTGGFTALIVLLSVRATTVTPLRSSYVHVIGTEIDWAGMAALLSKAGVAWDAVVFEAVADEAGGPVDDATARVRLRLLEARLAEDRLAINEGHFFDRWGRRLRIEEVAPS